MADRAKQDTPGGLIRATRESRDISMTEMSERTKIPPPVLQAIERDEYHKVSGALYIKSFLRTCAVEIGLDPDEILDLYASFSGEVKRPAPGADMVWEEEEVQISHIGLPWRNIAVVGLALILVGFGALTLLRGGDSDPDTTDGTRPQTTVPAVAGAEPSESLRPDEDTGGEVVGPDTLAGAWTSGADRTDAPEAITGTTLPEGQEQEQRQPEQKSAQADRSATAAEVAPPVATGPQAAAEESAPLPLVGGPRLVFAGGRRQPVVLRIICDRPLGIQVKRDAEQSFQVAAWPHEGADAPPLPPTGIEDGRVYAISRGLVVYWGADDHLSLRLDRTDGVEVALNGRVRNVRNLRPGGELLLDAHGD